MQISYDVMVCEYTEVVVKPQLRSFSLSRYTRMAANFPHNSMLSNVRENGLRHRNAQG